MKQIAHTINRDGKLVPANGFKQPEPTEPIINRNIWMHSIDRTDTANPVVSFMPFIVLMAFFVMFICFIFPML